ncbi:MAG: ribbon-helix-helix domain-containing protein [Candidatus Nanohaloarchaea archaeon]
MPTVSVNIPEKMREKMKELSEEGLYQNESEYIRDALREKIKSDTGLTPEEEEIVAERLRKAEKGETDWIKLEDLEEEIGSE